MRISSLSGKSFSLIETPIPPLAKQNRIVEKLEKLVAFCDDLETNIRESRR